MIKTKSHHDRIGAKISKRSMDCDLYQDLLEVIASGKGDIRTCLVQDKEKIAAAWKAHEEGAAAKNAKEEGAAAKKKTNGCCALDRFLVNDRAKGIKAKNNRRSSLRLWVGHTGGPYHAAAQHTDKVEVTNEWWEVTKKTMAKDKKHQVMYAPEREPEHPSLVHG